MILSYDNFILHSMTTISVPLSAELLTILHNLIVQGKAANNADAMRKALKFYAEQQAVEDVLKASREPTLHGNLDELMQKIA